MNHRGQHRAFFCFSVLAAVLVFLGEQRATPGPGPGMLRFQFQCRIDPWGNPILECSRCKSNKDVDPNLQLQFSTCCGLVVCSACVQLYFSGKGQTCQVRLLQVSNSTAVDGRSVGRLHPFIIRVSSSSPPLPHHRAVARNPNAMRSAIDPSSSSSMNRRSSSAAAWPECAFQADQHEICHRARPSSLWVDFWALVSYRTFAHFDVVACVRRSYNRKEGSFASTKEFYDYLEEVESLGTLSIPRISETGPSDAPHLSHRRGFVLFDSVLTTALAAPMPHAQSTTKFTAPPRRRNRQTFS